MCTILEFNFYREVIIMRITNAKHAIPSRIAQIRSEKGLTQTGLQEAFNNNYKDSNISLSAISMWERGRRPVSDKYLDIYVDYFKVSKAFLLGFTDNKDEYLSDEQIKSLASGNYNAIDESNPSSSVKEVLWKELFRFDHLPLYVEYPTYEHPSAWCIYDYANEKLVFTDRVEQVGPSMQNRSRKGEIKFYAMSPDYATIYADNKKKPLELLKVREKNRVYVKMLSPSPIVRAMYDGWYKNNENKTALIKSNGLVLPYEGIGISYNAFSEGDFNLKQ